MPEQDQNTGTDWSEDAPNAAAPAKQPEPSDILEMHSPSPGEPGYRAPLTIAEIDAMQAPLPQSDPPATPVMQEPAKPSLPPNLVASLRQVFRDVAAVVGQDKADFVLAEFYGVTSPDALRAADLLDAIDKLYEAA